MQQWGRAAAVALTSIFVVLGVGVASAAAADWDGKVVTHVYWVAERDGRVPSCVGGSQRRGSNANSDIDDAPQIYLCVFREAPGASTFGKQPITDFDLIVRDTRDDDPDCPSGWDTHDQNLNSGAGGKFIYLCAERDANSQPVTDAQLINADIEVGCFHTKATGGLGLGWKGAGGIAGSHGTNLNQGAGGDIVHLCYRTLEDEEGTVADELCGNEGEPRCAPLAESTLWNGNQRCDRGLEADDDGVCRNGNRHELRDELRGDAVTWALENQTQELQADVPFNHLARLGAHNAFNNANDGYDLPNQQYSISDVLDAGVRIIDLDLHGEFVHINAKRMRLCHSIEGGAGCDAAKDRFVYHGLKEVRNWMRAHPEAVVHLVLEVYPKGDSFSSTMRDEINGYLERYLTGAGNPGIYTPADKTALGAWPTQRQMVAAGKRVMVFSQNQDFGGTWAFKKGSGGNSTFFAGGTKTWDADKCTISGDARAVAPEDGTMWEVYESDVDGTADIDASAVRKLLACGVDIVNVDNMLDKDPGGDRLDTRLQAAVWSWAAGETGAGGPAASRRTDGAWISEPLAMKHKPLCLLNGQDGLQATDYVVGLIEVVWAHGFGQCEQLGGKFYAPTNPAENAAAPRSEAVWLNYSSTRTDDGRWQANRVSLPNAAPVLDPSGTTTFAAVAEDAGDPAGMTVSSLLASAGGDRITDEDGSPDGIALTATGGSGTWQVSEDGGAVWRALPVVSSTSALLLPAGATLRFLPAADVHGTIDPALVFRAWDGTSGTAYGAADTTEHGGTTAFSAATESVALTVTAVNDPPSFTKGADQAVTEDAGAQGVAGWATAIAGGPGDEANEVVTFAVTTTAPERFAVAPAVSPSGELTYTPAKDATGTATIAVVARDAGGASSPAQLATITLTPVNDAPVLDPAVVLAAPDVLEDATGGDGTTVQDLVGAAVTDVDGDPEGARITGADQSGGRWQTSADGGATWQALGTPTVETPVDLQAADRVRYLPGADRNGVVDPALTLRAWDGSAASAQQDTVAITVVAVNDPPRFVVAGRDEVAEDSGPRSREGFVTEISPGPADEAGQTVTFSVSAASPALLRTGPAISAGGTLSYTPAPDANGVTALTIIAKDSEGATATRSSEVSVTPVNDAPTARADAAAVDEDVRLELGRPGVLGNDADVDGDDLDPELVTGPRHGTLELDADGALRYLPQQDFFGTDRFTYRASDGELSSPPVEVVLTVNPVNDRPTIALATSRSRCLEEGADSGLVVADVDDAASSLIVTATSSDPLLVAPSGLAVSGTGAERSLRATTAARAAGTAVLTAQVDDGELTARVPITLRAGGNGDQALDGTPGADVLLGQNGTDVLRGLAGHDLLCGGRGDDGLRGGDGADRFDGGAGADRADDASADPGDTVEGALP